jgi:hypothetical protein
LSLLLILSRNTISHCSSRFWFRHEGSICFFCICEIRWIVKDDITWMIGSILSSWDVFFFFFFYFVFILFFLFFFFFKKKTEIYFLLFLVAVLDGSPSYLCISLSLILYDETKQRHWSQIKKFVFIDMRSKRKHNPDNHLYFLRQCYSIFFRCHLNLWSKQFNLSLYSWFLRSEFYSIHISSCKHEISISHHILMFSLSLSLFVLFFSVSSFFIFIFIFIFFFFCVCYFVFVSFIVVCFPRTSLHCRVIVFFCLLNVFLFCFFFFVFCLFRQWYGVIFHFKLNEGK